MKKLTLALVIVAVASLGFGVSASLEAPAVAAVTDTAIEAAPVCSIVEPLPFGTVDFTNNTLYCGTPCSVEGAVGACVDSSGTHGLCECSNMSWNCLFGGF